MTKIEKQLQRIQKRPKDFTWDELTSLMISQGFEMHSAGGSSRKFIHTATGYPLCIHEPHPGNIIKPYAVRAVITALENVGAL